MGPQRIIDQHLRLTHFCARPLASSEFIMLHSIIHGVLIVPDFAVPGDHFLVDYVDTDIFLHSQRRLF
ncbi:hypothetical protein DFJ58DRAFT_661193 [Suillus subalutaceus]|uniref:uncharacterized protein n=1 Tax=Suillus subalutaceus TaxID=48586 RepID=UPI001B85E662|nr:uncharacterized protein DFJ58DRAFT_661193 [Suillus subalutaceus]KAG1852471.1 hypothetical protein DFJ58DRAFT_661193 [Suillus subalutaceus]